MTEKLLKLISIAGRRDRLEMILLFLPYNNWMFGGVEVMSYSEALLKKMMDLSSFDVFQNLFYLVFLLYLLLIVILYQFLDCVHIGLSFFRIPQRIVLNKVGVLLDRLLELLRFVVLFGFA